MNVIDITVTNRRVQISGAPMIVCGNSDYVLRFTLDAEWNDAEDIAAKIAYLRCGKPVHETVPLTDGQCELPVIRGTDMITVGITGGNVRTAAPARILCIPCVTDIPGKPAEVRRDVFNELMELLNRKQHPGEHTYLANYTHAELAQFTHAELSRLA